MKIFKIIFLIILIPTSLLANTDYFNEGLMFYKKNDFEKA